MWKTRFQMKALETWVATGAVIESVWEGSTVDVVVVVLERLEEAETTAVLSAHPQIEAVLDREVIGVVRRTLKREHRLKRNETRC